GVLNDNSAVFDIDRIDHQRLFGGRIQGIPGVQVEAGQVERAGDRVARDEALVELEILMATDALNGTKLAAQVYDEHLLRAVHPAHLHGARGDIADRHEVDPARHLRGPRAFTRRTRNPRAPRRMSPRQGPATAP